MKNIQIENKEILEKVLVYPQKEANIKCIKKDGCVMTIDWKDGDEEALILLKEYELYLDNIVKIENIHQTKLQNINKKFDTVNNILTAVSGAFSGCRKMNESQFKTIVKSFGHTL